MILNDLWKHRPGHKPVERNIKMSGEWWKISAFTCKYLPHISRDGALNPKLLKFFKYAHKSKGEAGQKYIFREKNQTQIVIFFDSLTFFRQPQLPQKMTAAKSHFNFKNAVETLGDSLKPSTSVKIIFLDYFLLKYVQILINCA